MNGTRAGRTSVRDNIREWLVRPVHWRAVRDFGEAAAHGDVARMSLRLHPDVAVVVDAGDETQLTIRVVRGIDEASSLLARGLGMQPDLDVEERSVNNQAGLMVTRAGRALATIAVDFTGELVSMVWVRLNPVPLRHWNTV